jgi:hypothetical protein
MPVVWRKREINIDGQPVSGELAHDEALVY